MRLRQGCSWLIWLVEEFDTDEKVSFKGKDTEIVIQADAFVCDFCIIEKAFKPDILNDPSGRYISFSEVVGWMGPFAEKLYQVSPFQINGRQIIYWRECSGIHLQPKKIRNSETGRNLLQMMRTIIYI